MAEDKPRDENRIAALKRERAGYVQRGEDDRVVAVDAELRKAGYTGDQDPAPKGRVSRTEKQRTATEPTKPADKTGKSTT